MKSLSDNIKRDISSLTSFKYKFQTVFWIPFFNDDNNSNIEQYIHRFGANWTYTMICLRYICKLMFVRKSAANEWLMAVVVAN